MAEKEAAAGQIMFSVIVPVYNVEIYLRTCIDSILGQTYPHFELILVNDGSTDNCGNICEEYRAKDARIVLIHQKNQGLLAARRAGIRQAKGDYFIHVDSDDACEATLLEQLNRKILASGYDLVLYGYSVIDERGNRLKDVRLGQMDAGDGAVTKECLLQTMLRTTVYNNIWTKCARRTIVDIAADYSPYGRLMMGEDVLQSMPLIENASKIGLVDMPLYLYRVVSGSMSRRIRKEYIFHHLQVRKRVYEALIACGCSAPSIMSEFFAHYHHEITGYLYKLVLVCSRAEYTTIVDGIKKQMLSEPRYDGIFLSVLDKACFRIAMSGHYTICKTLALLRAKLKLK